MRISRRTWAIIGILIILIAIPATILLLGGNLDFRKSAASNQATFSFDPTSGVIVQGGEVEIKVLIDSGAKNIIGADAVISFDRNILTVVDTDADKTGTQVQPGSFFDKPLILANKVDNNRIYLSINSFTPFKGAAVFGTIKFQAKKTGIVDLKFVDGETKITEQGTAQNILQKMAAAQFTVERSGTAQKEGSSSATPTSNLDVDLNSDGKVDDLDLQIFAQKMGATTNITNVDFNKDGKVDGEDFKLFEKAFKDQRAKSLTP